MLLFSNVDLLRQIFRKNNNFVKSYEQFKVISKVWAKNHQEVHT